MKRWAMVIAATAALLLLPAAAMGGGWATVHLDSLPAGVEPGEPWDARLTVLQHGQTPLDGVEPAVIVEGPGGERRTVVARPAGEPGVYRARVVFPTAGRWSLTVDDGFTATHSYGAVRIGGDGEGGGPVADPAPDGGGIPWLTVLAVALGVGLVAAVGATSRVRGAR
jgi:hypothetical protein